MPIDFSDIFKLQEDYLCTPENLQRAFNNAVDPLHMQGLCDLCHRRGIDPRPYISKAFENSIAIRKTFVGTPKTATDKPFRVPLHIVGK